ncbi:MAG: ABC transporter ATP-binding protein [Pseudomonadota bacterium]
MSISLTSLSKSFKNETVLEDVSLGVPTGETLVLFGPSGVGKTVLLRLIAGVIDPDNGTIELNGRDMTGVEPEDRGIGMAFQNFALFPHLDASDNIASPLTARRQSSGVISETVGKVARLLKIEHVLSHKPKELSNGQKQRTSLARALAGQPSILLLDDPLRNVDAKLRFEMRLELPRLLADQNATVIYVTQDYKEAMAFGHQIAVLSETGIRQIGTPEEIYLTPATTDIARLFGDPVINLLDVTPQQGNGAVMIEISGRPIALDAGYQGAVGQTCTLGIRPESITFVEDSAPGAIPVTIEAETPLNEKTVTLTATSGGREIMTSRPAGTPAPAEGQAYIQINPAAALLFDRNTGDRIEPDAELNSAQGDAA